MTHTSIMSFLMEHADKKTVSFHMPGHKGSAIYKRFGYEAFLNKIMDCDITEIEGEDNLFKTEGIIKQTQDKYAKLYEVKKSYLLINGTSSGLIAAILANSPKGKKTHHGKEFPQVDLSMLFVLADIQPVYAYPEMIDEYGISGEVTAEEIRKASPRKIRCRSSDPPVPKLLWHMFGYQIHRGCCSQIWKNTDRGPGTRCSSQIFP